MSNTQPLTKEQQDKDDFRFAFNNIQRKQIIRVNRESIKLSPNHNHLFLGVYPRKVGGNHDLKFLHLKKLVRKQEISPERFVEFAKILNIKDKEEKIYITIGEILGL